MGLVPYWGQPAMSSTAPEGSMAALLVVQTTVSASNSGESGSAPPGATTTPASIYRRHNPATPRSGPGALFSRIPIAAGPSGIGSAPRSNSRRGGAHNAEHRRVTSCHQTPARSRVEAVAARYQSGRSGDPSPTARVAGTPSRPQRLHGGPRLFADGPIRGRLRSGRTPLPFCSPDAQYDDRPHGAVCPDDPDGSADPYRDWHWSGPHHCRHRTTWPD
jgi:hypothetical protein